MSGAMNSFCTHVRGPNGCVWCDYGHVALGVGTALLPPALSITASGCFLVYQLLRAKSDRERLVSLGQFGAGFVGVSLL